MTITGILTSRLLNQGLTGPGFKSPADCLNHMGVMQAQDFTMAKWALGIRIKDSNEAQINKALDKGEILRTHLLRPTWHFVSAKNIYWMLELSAPRIRAAMKSRDKQLGLNERIFLKSNRVIEKALETNGQQTRAELMTALNKNKILTNENRSSHLFAYAELSGLICSGPANGIKNTYALLEKRVSKPASITRDEALARLAKIYFSSHCPAGLLDFNWWSGLSMADSKLAIELNKKDIRSIKISDQTFYVDHTITIPKTTKKTSHLLPAFDEFLVSYKNRSAAIAIEHHKKAFSSNGIFNPTIVMHGQVIGLWKRNINKDVITIETDFFGPTNDLIKRQAKKAAQDYAKFLGKKPEIIF